MSIFREHKTVADRTASDRRRHKQKIEKAIRDGIHHIVADESIIGQDGKQKYRIPVRGIKEYRFVYGSNGKQVGSAPGRDVKRDQKIGDPPPDGQGGQQVELHTIVNQTEKDAKLIEEKDKAVTLPKDADKYAGKEKRFSVDSSVALNLRRIAVITSGRTCSAAESLVMLLKPYIEVGVIGAQTCGKPYTAHLFHYDNWEISVLTKTTQNATGETVSSDGLAPDCYADDNSSFAMGGGKEKSLKVALHWLTKDKQCLPVATDY